ncbi:hypothetical protein GCM10025860_26820 [Methanobacterium ferruginis]|nr:hypothetical protein GCM10025860_26820 [Methanobacterium ferruginis]
MQKKALSPMLSWKWPPINDFGGLLMNKIGFKFPAGYHEFHKDHIMKITK